MNLGELRTAARLRLHDTNSSKYLWADAELDGYINEAVNEACLRARLNLDSTTTEVTTISVVAGTATYAVHESIFFIERMFLNTSKKSLTKVGFQDLDEESDVWQDDTGTPTYYLADWDFNNDGGTQTHNITLYPIPEVTETMRLTVYRFPLSAMVSDSNEPEIHAFHHPYLIDWVCHKAYQKNDTDSLKADKSLEFGKMFEQKFGARPTASLLEWRRKQRRKRTVARWL
jgi:hypothetical protein